MATLASIFHQGINAIPFSQLGMLGYGLGNPGPPGGAYLERAIEGLNRGIMVLVLAISDVGVVLCFLRPSLLHTMSDIELWRNAD